MLVGGVTASVKFRPVFVCIVCMPLLDDNVDEGGANGRSTAKKKPILSREWAWLKSDVTVG